MVGLEVVVVVEFFSLRSHVDNQQSLGDQRAFLEKKGNGNYLFMVRDFNFIQYFSICQVKILTEAHKLSLVTNSNRNFWNDHGHISKPTLSTLSLSFLMN